MNNAGGMGGRRALAKRDVRNTSVEGLELCKSELLDFQEAIWAVEALITGVSQAVSNAPPCDRYYLCQTAKETASVGPLASTLAILASEWLDSWPDLEHAHFGEVVRLGVTSRNCAYYSNSSCAIPFPSSTTVSCSSVE
ncbi:uncharacterized protein [Macrobrachium rosenbergii]|uniref:uncharacterized protein n=1 Tax=Macrobrachium rosenbergii TaxID=79674 RepID=UPI0034D5C41D